MRHYYSILIIPTTLIENGLVTKHRSCKHALACVCIFKINNNILFLFACGKQLLCIIGLALLIELERSGTCKILVYVTLRS